MLVREYFRSFEFELTKYFAVDQLPKGGFLARISVRKPVRMSKRAQIGNIGYRKGGGVDLERITLASHRIGILCSPTGSSSCRNTYENSRIVEFRDYQRPLPDAEVYKEYLKSDSV